MPGGIIEVRRTSYTEVRRLWLFEAKMRSKHILVLFVLCAVMLALNACGGGSMSNGTSDMSGTPTNGVADKTDAANGSMDDSIIPGASDMTTTPGNVSDMPNTEKPGGADGELFGGNSRDTGDTAPVTTEAPDTTAPTTTAPTTTPAVRPPEGK